MPRIDPIQLLNCLGVLLSPEGGIKSRDEVQRLVILMTKYSKKLVSKCIYIQILKCTDTNLLGLFMGSEGWLLVHMWLTESIVAKNWPLVKELLELLLLCPVDIERLKTNNCPKLVKELSKDEDHFAVRVLASKLVEQWLKTVKGEQVVPIKLSDLPQIISDVQPDSEVVVKTECSVENNISVISDSLGNKSISEEEVKIDRPNEVTPNHINNVDITEKTNEENETLPILKINLKDGKQTISQVGDENESKTSETFSDSEKTKERSRSNRDKAEEKNRRSSSSSKHSSRSHSSSDKHKKSHRSSSSHNSSSKDKLKDKEKDKRSSSSSKSKSDSSRKSSDKSSSSSSKTSDRNSSSDKDKNKVKEDKNKKDNLNKSIEKSSDKSDDKPPSIHKLGKIPKLSDVKKERPSISIEVRKPDEPKPKTVKTFNSKFRKHGLEEEVKPPPSRAAVLTKKTTTPLPPIIPIPKRPSPVQGDTPPEKKPKIVETVEKPGAIKLIPPKPKPMLLLESDMFMDALNASATNKKDPKKRKRRTSGSKDGNPLNETSPPNTPTTVSSPSNESKSVPPRFYQDTLETEDNKEKASNKDSAANEDGEKPVDAVKTDTEEKMDTSEPHTLTINGLKGVLCYHKRKGPKKSIKWKSDSELEEIQYFELDETERVNVTKTFTDMKYLERIHERDAFQKGRNLSNDDVMEEKTNWRPLIPVDADGQIQVDYGKNSKEKDIQAIRQKGTLQPLYFSKAMIPDSALEPDLETHPYSEPTIIPLEDVTGNQDNISDFRNMPWPEPKGNAPPASTNINVPTMFPSNINQFPNSFPNPQFPVVGVPPGFQGVNIVPSEWATGVPPHIMPNGMSGPMPPPGPIPPGNMPPGIMMPPENMMMNPEMFGGPNPMFPVPPDGFNMQQNMFPMEFNMPGPQGLPGPDNFPGPGNFRGAMRGRGTAAGGHWRGKNGGNWDGPQRGRGGAPRGGRKAVCIYFQRKGSCRQGDNCSFLHPGVNCPF